jgi:hypothetical protein
MFRPPQRSLAIPFSMPPGAENTEVVLLTSPMAWLYWKDYLGLDPDEAAATAGWAIKALASRAGQ